MKRILIILGSLVVLLIVAIVLFKNTGGRAERVAVEKAEVRNITESVSANGKVQPEVQVKITALDHLLDRGPLARRILAATGADPSPARLRALATELCDCLREGRLFDGLA